MNSSILTKLNNFRLNVFISFMVGIFYLLPSKVSKIFISIAIVSFVNSTRGNDELVDQKKFNELIKVNYGDEVFALPELAANWLWDEKFLSRRIFTEGRSVTLKEAILDNRLFDTGFEKIISEFVYNLPTALIAKVYEGDRRGSKLCGNVYYMLA